MALTTALNTHTSSLCRSVRLVQRARPHQLQRRSASMQMNATAVTASSTELLAACNAVRLASKLCKKVQKQLTTSEKQDKNDDSPVTIADYGAQALVTWSLQQALPGIRISMVAEEDSSTLRDPAGKQMLARITGIVNETLAAEGTGSQVSEADVIDLIDLGASEGGAVGDHWVLDPIDGTRGFVGMRQYAVCLGLLREGEVVLGVLGCPNLPVDQVRDEDGGSGAADSEEGVGSLFSARKGHGAWAQSLWDADVAPERITVKDVADISKARFMESFESRHSDHSFTARMAQEIGVVLPPLRMDSQVKYGLLSRGDASIFMRFPPASYREKIWDHCGGCCIVEEAGGKVTDAAGRRLDFSEGRWLALDRGIVAAPPSVHSALIAAINKPVS